MTFIKQIIQYIANSVLFLSGIFGISNSTYANIPDGAPLQGTTLATDAEGIIYVKTTAVGNGNGTDWDNATNDLHNAIHAAGVKKVFVAIGVYNVGSSSFVMKNGVEIYGGFDPEHNIKTLNDARIFPSFGTTEEAGSVLHGQTTRPVVWNVFTSGTRLNNTAVLDGFTITRGRYDADGGGIRNHYASPILRNLVIKENIANYGGGISNRQSSPKITNVSIVNNIATSSEGAAGMYNELSSSPILTNVTIAYNKVTSSIAPAGGVRNSGSTPSPHFYNCILWGNTIAGSTSKTGADMAGIVGGLKNSITQLFSTGNIQDNNLVGTDPKFTDVEKLDYTLQPSSLAIDAGSNSWFIGLNTNTKDLAGNARVYGFGSGGIVDMGAYESPYIAPGALRPDSGGIIYVTENGFGNGSSWGEATSDLHKAIHVNGVQKVYVAVGKYDVGEHSFVMKNNVEIYGGFDPENNIQLLSDNRILPNLGMGSGSVLNGQNTRPVIWNVFDADTRLESSALLDGFTIANGKYDDNGAGIRNIYASPTLKNLVITGNYNQTTAYNRGGAGIYLYHSSSTITNVQITANTSGAQGGGIWNDSYSNSVLTNVQINKNKGSFTGGSGFYNSQNASATLINVSITDNVSTNGLTGGLYNRGTLKLINVTIAGNTANNIPAAIYIQNTAPEFNNSIIYGQITGTLTYTANHSMIQGATDTTNGNIDATHISETDVFTDPSGGDYTLKSTSPAINKGDNTLYSGLGGNARDLARNPRLSGQNIDMGAYEFQCASVIDFKDVVFADSTISFDGDLHSIVARNVPAGAAVTYEITDFNNQTAPGNSAANVGIYTIKATISDIAASCNTITKTATFTINKGQTIITAHQTQTHVYDGSVKNVTAALNHSDTTLSYSPQQGYTSEGTYTIIISAPETENYLAASDTVNLIINKAEQAGITFSDSAFTYDGTSKSLAVTGLSPDATAVYTGNDKTNAGIYTVTALVSRENYRDTTLTATLTINKAQAIITADQTQTHVYDGSVKNVTAALNHSDTTLSYSPQQGYTSEGTYTIVISAPETDNYLAASDTVSLVIESECSVVGLPDSPDVNDYRVCSGGDITLCADCPAGNSVPKWYAEADGINEVNPMLSHITSPATYYVACVNTTLSACRSSLIPVKVEVDSPLSFSYDYSYPNTVYGCENGSAEIILDSHLITGSSYTLQWQKSDGGNFSDLTEGADFQFVKEVVLKVNHISPALNNSLFRVLISNSCNSVTSDTISLKLNQLPQILTQPVGQTVCVGNQTTLTVEAGAGLSYQWQADTGTGFVNLSPSAHYANVNSPGLTISDIQPGFNEYKYRCVVFNSCKSVNSDEAALVIDPTITILGQPVSRTVCQGNAVSFTVNAVHLSGGTLTFTWQRSTNGGFTYTNVANSSTYSGATTKTLTVTNIPAGFHQSKFRCVINGYCQSRGADLNVTPIATVTQSPTNTEICEGNNTSFSVKASGTGLSYRWQVNGGSGFQNIYDGGIYDGTGTPTLRLFYPDAATNGYQYRCVVWGTSSCDTRADTSAVATLSVGVSAESHSVVWDSPISSDEGTTQAVAYILGKNKILEPDGKAKYQAGQAIILEPGFEVEAGAVFEAKIKNPCQSANGMADIPKEIKK